MNSPDSGLADPLLGSDGSSGTSDRSLLPQSTIYSWCCVHFRKPPLTATDESEEVLARREEREKRALEHIAKCQHSGLYFIYLFSLFLRDGDILFYSFSC